MCLIKCVWNKIRNIRNYFYSHCYQIDTLPTTAGRQLRELVWSLILQPILVTYWFLRWELSAFYAWETARSWQLLEYFFFLPRYPHAWRFSLQRKTMPKNGKTSEELANLRASNLGWLLSYSFERPGFWKLFGTYLLKNSLLSSFSNETLHNRYAWCLGTFLKLLVWLLWFYLYTYIWKSQKWWKKKKNWEEKGKDGI